MGDRVVKLRQIAILGGLLAGTSSFVSVPLIAAEPAKQAQPAISADASAALQRMAQTLRAEQMSFQARTIRVYADPNGEPLHIFHTLKVTVRRPNRLLAEVSGDDGSNKLVFDGNTAIVGGPSDNSNIGAAWVYTRSGGVWSQQGPKLVGTGAVGYAEQGSSV